MAALELAPDPEIKDPISALATWSAETLKVPPGHSDAGAPLVLPDYATAFLRDALRCRESLLCMARKNGKSAICSVLALGYLCGPLNIAGWRGAVASLSVLKANELRRQAEDIAVSSNLQGLRFVRSPQPGKIEGRRGAVLDVLTADRNAGAASGFDLILVDELGLFPERSRELMAGLRSSISARDGRVISISIRGDSALLTEIIDRRESPGTAVHLFEAPADCRLDDLSAWQAANPGLGSIKSLKYMKDEAARVALAPADQGAFRAYDLNARLNPARDSLVDVDQWLRCETKELPHRNGPAFLALDLGGSRSMTAAAAYWPDTGRLEGWGAFAQIPDLLTRGRADAVGGAYQQMAAEGELHLLGSGEVTDVPGFFQFIAAELAGCRIVSCGLDRYRQSEARTAISAAGLSWPMVWRGTGASSRADGSHDVRAFQNAVSGCRVRVKKSTLWRQALAGATVRTDVAGNPALFRASSNSRIDVAQAGTIALGLAQVHAGRPRSSWRYRSAAE